jgi:hypothetical protein
MRRSRVEEREAGNDTLETAAPKVNGRTNDRAGELDHPVERPALEL